mmetsp:Transcript_26145/g.84381  ORF Transcript_26145/g.84381 Transcript_26145/m.84381 type:complete len:133 (-) Transcript_26145:1978-2376(-)
MGGGSMSPPDRRVVGGESLEGVRASGGSSARLEKRGPPEAQQLSGRAGASRPSDCGVGRIEPARAAAAAAAAPWSKHRLEVTGPAADGASCALAGTARTPATPLEAAWPGGTSGRNGGFLGTGGGERGDGAP